MAIGNPRHMLRSYFSMHQGRAKYEVIKERISAGERIDGIHLCLLIVAMLIASIGLNVDSTEAIVGSMLICPLMGSVLAIAYAFATVNWRMLRSSAFGLLIQMAICLTTSTLYFVISPISNATSELLTNTTPTVWDLLIALAGGIAGGIGNSRRQEPSTLIAGVAVATALMPPLCTAGFYLAMRSLMDVVMALYEFLINVVFIAFGAELIFVWLHVPLKYDLNDDGVVTPEERTTVNQEVQHVRRRLVFCTIAFAIPCVIVSGHVVHQTRINNGGEVFEATDTYDIETTTLELEAVCPGFSSYVVSVEDSYDIKQDSIVQHLVATITTTRELSANERDRLNKLVHIHVPQLDKLNFVTQKAPSEQSG